LEVGSIRRIQGLDTAYWGFLGVRRIGLLWIRRIELVFFVVFGECKHRYAVSSLMDTAYWSSE
ncbi:hypothetical protein Tco_0978040, partial [Tanacetum coccineum]